MTIEIRTKANDVELKSNIREYELSIPIVLNLDTDKEYEFNLIVSYEETIHAEEIDGHKEVHHFDIDVDPNPSPYPTNFAELEKHVSFLLLFGSILHSPKEARDIDIFAVIDNKKEFKTIDEIMLKIQGTQPKKIHFIDLTESEFEQELNNRNKAYLDALAKGIILYGQENFIRLIKRLQTK